MGSAAEKHFFVGQSLNDDIYHTLVLERRGAKVKAVVDDDAPLLGLFYFSFFKLLWELCNS